MDDLDTLEETLAWCQEVIGRYRAGERDPEGEAGPFASESQLDREMARALHRDGAACPNVDVSHRGDAYRSR